MRSLRIGSAAGIGIFLHWTFLVFVAGLFAFYLYQGETYAGALYGVALVLAIFVCVVLHELGHALTARRYDVPTRDITLYPIGGVARLQRIPEEPMKEFWIAVAGPLVNVVIAAVLFAVLAALGRPIVPTEAMLVDMQRGFLTTLAWINVVLVLFNLLPAFPMDGGRVLRALLATRLDYARATEIAANVGQGMAILFALVGILSNFVLLFIALFVWIGARQEAQQATMRALTEGIAVRQAMLTKFITLRPDATLGDAVQALLDGSDQDFPIVHDTGELYGVLTRRRLLQALAEQDRRTPLRALVSANPFTVEAGTMLDRAFARMREEEVQTAPVVRQGQLVGLLTLENVGELMMINSALKKAPRTLDALLRPSKNDVRLDSEA